MLDRRIAAALMPLALLTISGCGSPASEQAPADDSMAADNAQMAPQTQSPPSQPDEPGNHVF